MSLLVTPQDLARWTGQKRQLLEALSDGKIHDRATLARVSGATQLPSRISELRKAGWLIQCEVYRKPDEVHTYYQLTGFTGEDNTDKRHCPTCTCR